MGDHWKLGEWRSGELGRIHKSSQFVEYTRDVYLGSYIGHVSFCVYMDHHDIALVN